MAKGRNSLRIIDSDQTFCGPRVVPRLRLAALLDPLVQRLEDSRIHGGNHINCGVQLFFRHPRFPCVRKAPVHSRIAEPHHRDG
jgi:hypothetical protein